MKGEIAMLNTAMHGISVLRPVVAPLPVFFAAQQTTAADDFDLASMECLGTTRRRIKCGEPLYHAGENFTSIYIIRTGFFRSTMTLEDVLSPAIAYADSEQAQIARYLDEGGNLLWLVDVGPLHGLERLAEKLDLLLPPIPVDTAALAATGETPLSADTDSQRDQQCPG